MEVRLRQARMVVYAYKNGKFEGRAQKVKRLTKRIVYKMFSLRERVRILSLQIQKQ